VGSEGGGGRHRGGSRRPRGVAPLPEIDVRLSPAAGRMHLPEESAVSQSPNASSAPALADWLAEAEGQPTVIAAACRLAGDLVVSGDAIILGVVEGRVEVEGELVVGPEARVLGGIEGGVVHLSGRVEGDVICTRHLRLAATSVLEGNVHATAFSAEDGASCKGHVIIGPQSVEEAKAAAGRGEDLDPDAEADPPVRSDEATERDVVVGTAQRGMRNVMRRRQEALDQAAA